MSLDPEEVELLVELVSQVLDLLGPAEAPDDHADGAEETEETETEMLEHMLDTSTGPVQTPGDPILHRLLPDGYRNDDGAAEEFRRLTESGLRATKRGALQQVIDDLSVAMAEQPDGAVRLDLDAVRVDAWLPALTDVRLAFGTRIGVSEDMDDERAVAEPGSLRHAELAAYDWLSWLQDSIVRGISGD